MRTLAPREVVHCLTSKNSKGEVREVLKNSHRQSNCTPGHRLCGGKALCI